MICVWRDTLKRNSQLMTIKKRSDLFFLPRIRQKIDDTPFFTSIVQQHNSLKRRLIDALAAPSLERGLNAKI